MKRTSMWRSSRSGATEAFMARTAAAARIHQRFFMSCGLSLPLAGAPSVCPGPWGSPAPSEPRVLHPPDRVRPSSRLSSWVAGPHLQPETAGHVLRIVQESLTNVVKHAGARTITLCVSA